MESKTDTIKAYRTLDCAHKVRIHYLLPEAVPREFLDQFTPEEVTVTDFSRFVVGAKVHFSVLRRGMFHAAGVVGDFRLVVTYGKVAGSYPEAEVAEFEELLTKASGRSIERHELIT